MVNGPRASARAMFVRIHLLPCPSREGARARSIPWPCPCPPCSKTCPPKHLEPSMTQLSHSSFSSAHKGDPQAHAPQSGVCACLEVSPDTSKQLRPNSQVSPDTSKQLRPNSQVSRDTSEQLQPRSQVSPETSKQLRPNSRASRDTSKDRRARGRPSRYQGWTTQPPTCSLRHLARSAVSISASG